MVTPKKSSVDILMLVLMILPIIALILIILFQFLGMIYFYIFLIDINIICVGVMIVQYNSYQHERENLAIGYYPVKEKMWFVPTMMGILSALYIMIVMFTIIRLSDIRFNILYVYAILILLAPGVIYSFQFVSYLEYRKYVHRLAIVKEKNLLISSHQDPDSDEKYNIYSLGFYVGEGNQYEDMYKTGWFLFKENVKGVEITPEINERGKSENGIILKTTIKQSMKIYILSSDVDIILKQIRKIIPNVDILDERTQNKEMNDE